MRWFRNVYWYLRNRFWDHSHMLRTECKPGSYSDKVSMVPQALFCAVEDYVSRSGEDAFGQIDFNADRWNDARVSIIAILHFWHIERVEIRSKIDYYLNEWAKTCRITINETKGGCVWENKPEDEEASQLLLDKLHWYEDQLRKKTKRYARMVVDIHEYLWT